MTNIKEKPCQEKNWRALKNYPLLSDFTDFKKMIPQRFLDFFRNLNLVRVSLQLQR